LLRERGEGGRRDREKEEGREGERERENIFKQNDSI
jgi:hypothetical protein